MHNMCLFTYVYIYIQIIYLDSRDIIVNYILHYIIFYYHITLSCSYIPHIVTVANCILYTPVIHVPSCCQPSAFTLHIISTFNMIYVQFQLVINPSAAVLSRLTHGERCRDVLFGSVGTNCGRHQNFHSLDLHTAKKKHILIHSL